jgi:hypothetical protein
MSVALKIHREADGAPNPEEESSALFSSPEWITTLVGLLAQLEDRRARLPSRVRGNALAILETVDGMVAACDTLANDLTFPIMLDALQAEAIAKAGAFLMATHEAQQAAPTGVLRSLWSTITNKDATVGPQVRACLLAAFEALSAYFTLFTRAFPASAPRNWVDAASAFLGEFNTQIRDLPD